MMNSPKPYTGVSSIETVLVLTTQPIVCCSWCRTFPVGEEPVAPTTQQVGKALGQLGACFFVAVYVNVPLSRETEPDVNVVLTGVAFSGSVFVTVASPLFRPASAIANAR